MFYEEASSQRIRWKEGFEHFASIAKEFNLDWWTTGRILLPLNGIDAEVNDVDFYFYSDDLNKIYDAYSDYIIEPVVSDTWRSSTFKYYGLAYYHCTICFCVDPVGGQDTKPTHFGQYAINNLKTVNWNGYEVKVPPIELYINTLKSWGKTEYAESIEDALLNTINS